MGKYISELMTDQPIEYYVEKMTESTDLLTAAVKELSEEEFHDKREGYDPETGCNLAWVLYHLAEDEVHHREQISLLRKLYRHLKEG